MRWLPSLMLLPLGVYLRTQGAELLTVLLLLAIFSVIVRVISDRFQPRLDQDGG